MAKPVSRMRRQVSLKRRLVIGQRLRQIAIAPLALAAELAMLWLLIARRIDLIEWTLFHAIVALLLCLWAKWIGRRIRRNQLAWFLFAATAGLGPVGPLTAIFTGTLLIAFHRDLFDFNAWYSSLFPVETKSRVTELYDSLMRRKTQKSGAGVESFSDILSGDDSAKKRLAIGLVTRHFRPGFAPALKLALVDTDPSVRTQAATAVATIEGRFLARAQLLARRARERPKSFNRRVKVAQHYDDYAFTGLLDPERERDNRAQALEGYQEALKVRPREASLWLAIGRLLVRERRYDAAASWFTVAEARGLLTVDMVLWQLDALFRLGRYEQLRRMVDQYRPLFVAGGKFPPQVPGVLGLWTTGSIKAGTAA